jgi:anaerobic selenocysteine-containing dehydrogenase
MSARTVRSFCRICTAVCGILVDVEGDQVVSVRGDKEHPLSHGYTCPKGRSLPAMHHHPDRIEGPMMRINGTLQATTWDACLDDLARRLRGIIDTYGPASVGVFFGSGVGMDAAGYRTAQALHRAIGTPAKFSPLTIDATAKVLISDLMGGSPALTARPDFDNTALLIYIGCNPVVSHGHTVAMPDPVSAIRSIRRHGEVWVLDPRRTETANLASGHISARPGTDYALLAYLVREVLREGADRDFVDRYTSGVAELRDAVEPFALEHAAAVADVPASELQALLSAIRRSGRVAIETGTGVTMASAANVTQWLAWALLIVTGSMNQRGGMWFHPGFGNQLEAQVLPIAPPDGSLFGPGPSTRPEVRGFLGEWPCAALGDEIRAGNIRAVLNLGGHLLTAFPEANDLQPALESLDVLASIEIIANDTTAISTHVLPTKDQLERADVSLWDFLLPCVAAQHTPAVVDAIGERRSTWWVLAELGRRLGYDLADTSAANTDDAMLATITSRARCSFEELVEVGWVEGDYELPAPWVEQHVGRLGGWRLAPRLLVEQLAALPEPKALMLIPRRQAKHLNSQLDYLGDTAEVLLNPDDAIAASVRDGQDVLVRSANGEVRARAKVVSGIRRGVVSLPHGHQRTNVNVLTDHNDIDPLTGMTRYSGISVTVLPVSTNVR